MFCWELLCWVGNCDIDFLNFCHHQVWNLEISNLHEWNWNFGIIFPKFRKRKRKSTKYFKISWNPCAIPLKFCEMLLVLWNLINYCKILQFLIKFCKSSKYLRRLLLKWLGKESDISLLLLTFIHALKNGHKLVNFFSLNLMKVYGIWFSQSQTFSLYKISSRFVSFTTKIFHFTKILQLPNAECRE